MKENEPQFNIETNKLADKLEELAKSIEHSAEGIPPVNTIITYLRLGRLGNAKAVCNYDGDKISYYPELVDFFRKEFFADGDDPEAPPYFRD